MSLLFRSKTRVSSTNTLAKSGGPYDRAKVDVLFAVLAGLGTIFSRWPFQASLLNSEDAVNYALALDHLDVRLAQPQAPGYPLYVLLGRLFNFFLHDHRSALVHLSIVFSALGVVALYLAGREIFGLRAGILCALILATSPFFWFLGELPLPYTVDFFASTITGWLCYRMVTLPRKRIVWMAALSVGLAGALRLQTIMVLFPLFLYALRQRHWKTIIGAVAVAGSVFGLFFMPTVMVSGGPVVFLHTMQRIVPIFYSVDTLIRSTRASRFAGNLDRILRYTFATMGELALPLGLIGYLSRSHPIRFWRDAKLHFLAIWLLPTWILYLLVWPGNQGTIMVCTPPLFLLTGLGLDRILGHSRWIKVAGYASLVVVPVCQVAVFVLLPSRPFGDGYRSFSTYETIANLDDYHKTRLSLIETLPVEGTIVYANLFRLPQYYLPQYRTFSPPTLYRDDPNMVKNIISIQDGRMESWSHVSVETIVPPGTKRIVLYDLPSEALLADPSLVEQSGKNADTLTVVAVPAGASVLWTPEGLNVHALK